MARDIAFPWGLLGLMVAGFVLCLVGALLPQGPADATISVAGATIAAVSGLFLFRRLHGRMDLMSLQNEELSGIVSQMDALLRVTSQVTLARPLNEVLDEIHAIGGRILRSDRCVIFRADENLTALYTRGVPPEFGSALAAPYADRSGLFAAARGELIPVENCLRDRRLQPVRELLERERLVSLLFVPLMYERLVLGFMFLFFERPRTFTPEELSVASVFGCQAAIAIRHGQLRQEVDAAARDSRNMFDHASDLIWTVDPELRCENINRRGEELTGRKTGQWLNRPFVEFIAEADRLPFEEKVRATLAGKSQRFELRLIGQQGRDVYVTVVTTPLYREGEITGAALFGRDLSEERKLVDQLAQVQRIESLSALARGVAHDFNNILSSILGHATLLRAKLPAEVALIRHLDLIEKSAHRASRLTGQFLGFARRSRYKLETLDVNALVRDTVSLLERGIERTIEINVELDDGLPPIMGDVGQVQQVVMNLVLNARDSMEGEGKLWIRTVRAALDQQVARELGMRAGPCVAVGIRDTGKGIRPEDKPYLFDPVFAGKTLGKGQGLGLPLVYDIMKNHGGAVQVASMPGQGSTFTLYFPPSPTPGPAAESGPARVAAPTYVLPPPPAPTPVLPSQRSGCILVVDDEESVIEFACESLKEAGYDTLSATNGIEALALYDKNRTDIDVVVLDIAMPRMGGREAFFKLRSRDPALPIIIMSGYTAEEDVQTMTKAGAVAFLRKPFQLEELLGNVREAVVKRRASSTPSP